MRYLKVLKALRNNPNKKLVWACVSSPTIKTLDSQRTTYMPKTTITYWNPLNQGKWQPIDGLEGIAEELTLSLDDKSGEYTRLTRFFPKTDTTSFGGKSHEYPEEIFIVSGRLYDYAFEMWLETGHYASRPPGEIHGPFKTEGGCVVLEVSFPNKTGEQTNV